MDNNTKILSLSKSKYSRTPNTFFFNIALSLYILCSCMRDTDPSIRNVIDIPYHYIGYISILFSIPSIIVNYKYSIGNIILLIIVLSVSFFLYQSYGYFLILPLVFLVFAAYNIYSDHIAKVALITTVLSTSFVLLLCIVGLLPDNITDHSLGDSVSESAHSLGFYYYSGLSYRSITIVVLWLYLIRRNINWVDVSFLFFLSVITYYLSTTRLVFLVSLLFISLTVLVYKFRILSFRNKIWKFFGGGAYILSLSVFFLFLFLSLFSLIESSYFERLDKILSNRLSQSVLAFSKYDVRLFGNEIEMVGSGDTQGLSFQEYFYIDSGYVYWILAYGLLFTFFIISSYSFLALKAWKLHNPFLFSWLLIFALFNMVNDFFTASYINISFLFLFANISELNFKYDGRNNSRNL